MTTILALDSSASGAASVSKRLIGELLADWRARDAALTVTHRDLGDDPLPHLTPERLPGLAGKGETVQARETTVLADALVAELAAADVLVIGSPMYNSGVTFAYTAEGPRGLMTGKRAIVVETRGGTFSGSPMVAMDAQEPHLRAMLGLLGIADVVFVRAEGLAKGEEARAAAIEAARRELRELVPATLARAA